MLLISPSIWGFSIEQFNEWVVTICRYSGLIEFLHTFLNSLILLIINMSNSDKILLFKFILDSFLLIVLKLSSFYAIEVVIDAIWECLWNILNKTVNASGCFLGLIKFGFILINNHLSFRVNMKTIFYNILINSINFIQIIVF